MKTTLIIGTILLAITIAGCDHTSGIARRIQERSGVYARLTPDHQNKIEQGIIEVGFSTDMVYMALGRPQRTWEKTQPEGRVSIWTYRNMILPAESMALMTLNHPSRHGYTPGQTSANAPRSAGGGSGPEPSVDGLPDLPTETLHVFFLNEIVYEMKVET